MEYNEKSLESLFKYVMEILEEELSNNPQTRRKKFKYQNKDGVIHIFHIYPDFIEMNFLYDFDEKNGVFKIISPAYNFKIKRKISLEFSNWEHYV